MIRFLFLIYISLKGLLVPKSQFYRFIWNLQIVTSDSHITIKYVFIFASCRQGSHNEINTRKVQ